VRPSKNSGRRLIATAISALALITAVPAASAQLPGGMTMEEARAAIAAPIDVPAGETVTLDIGVPVSASYSGGGWSVSSAGTSVTVTAPEEPGAQASFSASALGQSATITLVATGQAQTPPAAALPDSLSAPGAPSAAPGTGPGAENPLAPGTAERSESAPETPGDSAGQESAPQEGAAPTSQPTPERERASEVDVTDTKYLDLSATIEGRSMTVSLGLGQAADLYRQFGDLDEESVSLQYLDVNGQIIEGVQRDIDVASRTLTLTYPEGQTPDNPFILQVVRDGKAVLVVRLIDESRQVAQPRQEGQSPEGVARPTETNVASMGVELPVLWLSLGIIAVIAAVVAAAVIRRRRRRP
jgi:hypothetical protein